MEEKEFSKQQMKQLATVINTAIADSEERMKDFTRSTVRAELRVSEAHIRVATREELESVLETNLFPVFEDHDRRIKCLEER